MKTLKFIFICLLILGVASMAIAKPAVGMGKAPGKGKAASALTEITVTGVEDPAVDVPAVKDAVDNYDVVTLSGTFNFGDTGSVEIIKDVEIIGDGTAKIIGGENPISCTTNKVNLAVKNLSMEDATWNAILVMKSAGLEISGCTIKNVKCKEPGGPYTYSVAIRVSTWPWSWPLGIDTANPEAITGDIIIRNNYLNPNVTGAPNEYAARVQMAVEIQATNANVLITENEIYNCNFAGILIDYNEGLTTITDNTIEPCTEPDPALYTCNTGITVGHLAGLYNTDPPLLQGEMIISRNNLVFGVNPWADGISVYSYASKIYGGLPMTATILIEHNNISAEYIWAGLSLAGVSNDLENVICQSNKIKGNFDFALYSAGLYYGSLSKNIFFLGNNHTGAQSTFVDTLFDSGTLNNTLVGYPGGTVADYGVDNIITGAYKYIEIVPGTELGQRIREAIDRKHDLLNPSE